MINLEIFLIGVILLFTFLACLKHKEEFSDAAQKADECGKSVTDIYNVIQAQKDEDTKTYNDAMNAWRAQKQNIQNAFQSDFGAWANACRGSACLPQTSFYTKIPNVDHPGYDFRSFDSDLNTCAQTCLEFDQCKWFLHNGSQCWIKGNNNERGWSSAFKTNSGMKHYNNFHGYNDDYWSGDVSSFDECSNKCRDDPRCNMSTFNGRQCWLKQFRNHNGDTYVKELVTPYKFPDNHPYITNQIGVPPVMKRTEVKIGDIICQDCRQSQDKLQVTDSKDVKMDQINTCIANLKQTAIAEQKKNEDTNTSNNTQNNTPNNTSNNTPNNTPNESTNIPAQNNKKLYIGIGVTIGICLLIVIGIIIFFTMKNKQEYSDL